MSEIHPICFRHGPHAGEMLSSLAEYIHAVGYQAAPNLVNGKKVTAIGPQALLRCKETEDVLAIGVECMANFTTGHRNTVISPYDGAFSLVEGSYNNLVGYAAMYSATKASMNNGIGHNILWALKEGDGNVANGHHALASLERGSYNTAHGYMAGYDLQEGNSNSFFGTNSGRGFKNGNYCTFIHCACPSGFEEADTMAFIGKYGTRAFLRIDLQSGEIFLKDTLLPIKWKNGKILL